MYCEDWTYVYSPYLVAPGYIATTTERVRYKFSILASTSQSSFDYIIQQWGRELTDTVIVNPDSTGYKDQYSNDVKSVRKSEPGAMPGFIAESF